MKKFIFLEPKVGIADTISSLSYGLKCLRGSVLVPVLRVGLVLCTTMSITLFIERVYMAIVILYVKLFRKKRYTKYKLESLDAMKGDVELNQSYPMVLIQIPMFNEKEVYKLSIGAACGLSWPSDRLIVQVLDDSTNEALREAVEVECIKWIGKGVNMKYETRNNRNGYKAGALREGLQKQYVTDCEFVVIFDADFQPDVNFLLRTIPFLSENPELGLVQARWKFVNADECLMTRLQEMSLDYHFSVEQLGQLVFGGFKLFMMLVDEKTEPLSKTWTLLGELASEVKNELPSTFKAYRFQQHRWSCGPSNLLKKMTKEIMLCQRVSIWKRFHIIYAFFVRKIVAHWVTFFFYCVIRPFSVLVPELKLTKPVAIYISLLNAVCTPRSLHLVVLWILFENVMSLHRTKAAIIGLLEANSERVGRDREARECNEAERSVKKATVSNWTELIMGTFMLFSAIYDMLFGKDHFFVYVLLQSGAFFIMAFGYVGTFIPKDMFVSPFQSV